MALSKDNVTKAKRLLKQLQTPVTTAEIEYDANIPDGDLLVLNNKKDDGGYESVFLRLNNPTDELLAKFEKTKVKVKSSSICYQSKRREDLGLNIWHIGWY